MLQERLTNWLSRPVPDRGTNCSPTIPVTLSSDIGRSRKENQDRIATLRVCVGSGKRDSFSVVALADGMGGMRNGAACASLAISSFFYALIKNRTESPYLRLDTAAKYANKSVFEFSKGKGGATLSAVMVTARHETHLVNIGDSRIYAIHDGANTVSRLTTDDSLEAIGGHGRDLLQFIGMGEGLQPHVNSIPNLETRVLLTSDGVHFISNETLSEIFLHSDDSKQVTERLLAIARWCGSPDNASLGVTKLSHLAEYLPNSGDAYIEVLDPFGSTQLMWVKDNPFINSLPSPSESLVESKPEPMLPLTIEKTEKAPQKKKRKRTKKKSSASKPKKSAAPAPLLEIEEDVETPKIEVESK